MILTPSSAGLSTTSDEFVGVTTEASGSDSAPVDKSDGDADVTGSEPSCKIF